MKFRDQPFNWKVILLGLAAAIVVLSLWYTNRLASQLADQEKQKVALWASAYKHLNEADDDTDIGFLFDVIKTNESVPVILTDQDENIIAWRNLDSLKAIEDDDYLKGRLNEMMKQKEPIKVEFAESQYNYIYYQDSALLNKLKYYPYAQLGIIALFLLIAYIAFNNARQAEQNKVWVGMAKETAHQLGTPISSLVAWTEYLNEHVKDSKSEQIVQEMQNDIGRLELVAERFSKIGSTPNLEKNNIIESIDKTLGYIKKRSSDHVDYQFTYERKFMDAEYNPHLFEWVIENLLKNALDAMHGKGNIEINATQAAKNIVIDIKDSGKGISKAKYKTVFQPGYSTKKRGWGLGLSLSKRIIEEYHNGKIFVKESIIERGTTFRIIIPSK